MRNLSYHNYGIVTNQGVISVSSAKSHVYFLNDTLAVLDGYAPSSLPWQGSILLLNERTNLTGIFNVISDGDGFEPSDLSCFYNLIKNVKPNKTLLYDSFLLREIDSNYRPHGYEPRELTNCSTPQFMLLTGNGFFFCPN